MLAHAAARGVVQRGVSAQVEHCLVTAGRGARRSTARDRWRGARARVRVSRAPAPGTAVVLVDDVITSGATLAACVAALEDCAAAVVTSLTLAATPSSSVRPDVGLG
jgi:predicted amidophosphoribosyltransferase